ncbi:pre-mRNA-splicing factor 38B [Anastrepha obliqua]|uniref:pre-mRNA-splicing factor 38B n=1 Tax=Anastrepha obliqua TaxID=95512 RepID=UPI00240A2681|nr:pre-mRNA-splicing factor 38B [Anastrepha obliqua]
MNDQSEEINNAANNTRLRTFIEESKVRLRAILERLEWNVEKDFVLTPGEVNATKPDVQQPYDSEPEFPSSYPLGNSIITDVEELRKIVKDADAEVPRKFSDLQLKFTRQQKLALYEHVVMNTEKYTGAEITVPDVGEGTLTFAEIVAQKKRDTKKRRRYRQSKPTRIEEVRAVVDLQMQALQQYLNAKEVKEQRLEPTHRHRSDEEHIKSRIRQSRDHLKHHKHRRSRSSSLDDKRSKKSRHKNRSPCKKYKEHIRDSSSIQKGKKHKYRSRSRTRSPKKKSHKRRSRSQSRRRSRSRKHNSHRKSAKHRSHE